jgi:hypothetical protein
MVVQLWYQNSSTFTCWELTISSGFAGNHILQANSLTLQMNGSFCKRPLKIISFLKKICLSQTPCTIWKMILVLEASIMKNATARASA